MDSLIARIGETYSTVVAVNACLNQWPVGSAERRKMRWDARRVSNEWCDAKAEATNAFARLNGWCVSDKWTGFEIKDQKGWPAVGIGSGRRHDIMDHVIMFREAKRPFRPAAVVTQPYNRNETFEPLYGKLGGKEITQLTWHAPPNELASIHFPGSTYFYVITRSGVTVRWLPEQIATEQTKEGRSLLRP